MQQLCGRNVDRRWDFWTVVRVQPTVVHMTITTMQQLLNHKYPFSSLSIGLHLYILSKYPGEKTRPCLSGINSLRYSPSFLQVFPSPSSTVDDHHKAPSPGHAAIPTLQEPCRWFTVHARWWRQRVLQLRRCRGRLHGGRCNATLVKRYVFEWCWCTDGIDWLCT